MKCVHEAALSRPVFQITGINNGRSKVGRAVENALEDHEMELHKSNTNNTPTIYFASRLRRRVFACRGGNQYCSMILLRPTSKITRFRKKKGGVLGVDTTTACVGCGSDAAKSFDAKRKVVKGFLLTLHHGTIDIGVTDFEYPIAKVILRTTGYQTEYLE